MSNRKYDKIQTILNDVKVDVDEKTFPAATVIVVFLLCVIVALITYHSIEDHMTNDGPTKDGQLVVGDTGNSPQISNLQSSTLSITNAPEVGVNLQQFNSAGSSESSGSDVVDPYGRLSISGTTLDDGELLIGNDKGTYDRAYLTTTYLTTTTGPGTLSINLPTVGSSGTYRNTSGATNDYGWITSLTAWAPILFQPGSAANPGVTFTGSTGTGIYAASNTIGYSVGGSANLVLTTTQSTSSATTGLRVSDGSTASPGLYFSADSGTGCYALSNTLFGISVSGSTVMSATLSTASFSPTVSTTTDKSLLSMTGTLTSSSDTIGVIQIAPSLTTTTGSAYGISITPSFTVSGAATEATAYAITGTLTSTKTITNYRGHYARLSTTGTITNAFGAYFKSVHGATGTLTNQYGLYIGALSKSSGTVSTSRGLVVYPQSVGTNYYTGYFEGPTPTAGACGFGTTTPQSLVDVRDQPINVRYGLSGGATGPWSNVSTYGLNTTASNANIITSYFWNYIPDGAGSQTELLMYAFADSSPSASTAYTPVNATSTLTAGRTKIFSLYNGTLVVYGGSAAAPSPSFLDSNNAETTTGLYMTTNAMSLSVSGTAYLSGSTSVPSWTVGAPQLLLSSGTVLAPGLALSTTPTDTGFYYSATNTSLNWSLLGVRAGSIHGSGNSGAYSGVGAAANTTGSWNTVVGYQALNANVSGTRNACVGYRSLYTCTGGYNTAVGSSAGLVVASGTDNVFLGKSSGSALSGTSSRNVCVGSAAGSGTPGTYNDSIYLGYNTQATTSNEILIGASTTEVSIVGDVLVGVEADSFNAAVSLDCGSTASLGFLLPVMTAAQRDTITTEGIMVFITDSPGPGVCIYNGTNWLTMPWTNMV